MDIYSILNLISIIFYIYTFMIIIYVLMSWVPAARESFIGKILEKFCEPYLGIFRKFIPPIGGMLDISPIIALFLLNFIETGLRIVVINLYRILM